VATWQEIVARYGYTPWRSRLLSGLFEALQLLRAAGCKRVYLNGSFISSKERPGDFDACWEDEGVNYDLLDARLLTFDYERFTQKTAFLGELFIANSVADQQGTFFREFFQTDRIGRPKGIVVIELEHGL
jgi:hypothetical protein